MSFKMETPRQPHSLIQYSKIRPEAEEPFYAYVDCPECCALTEEEFELGKYLKKLQKNFFFFRLNW